MKSLLAAVAAVLLLAACGEEAPAPAPEPSSPTPLALPTPAQAPAPEPKVAEASVPDLDGELAQRVKRALEGAPKVHAAEIDVTAAAGTVTLWGTAATEDARKQAAAVAGKVDGVKSVQNRLAVVKGS